MYNFSSFFPIEHQFSVIVGNSGAGKSSFCKILCEYILASKKIYYFNPNSLDFKLRTKPIIVLKSLEFSEVWLSENIELNSILIFDDFVLEKSSIIDFRRTVNYYCRHKQLTLIIIIHTLFNNNVYNEVNLSSHLFLIKSQSSRQIASRKKILEAYDSLVSSSNLVKQLLYVNLSNEYTLSIESNLITQTLRPIMLFSNKQIFTVHEKGKLCPDQTTDEDEDENIDIYDHYSSRNKRKIFFILSCLKKNQILKDNQVIVDKTQMHIYDVLSLFLNPFPKKKLSKHEISFLKKLKLKVKAFPLPRNVIPPHIIHLL